MTMKILLLSSKFFGYSDRVANELKKEHDVICEYPYTYSTKERILRKLHIYYDRTRKYFGGIVAKYDNIHFDKIIVFGGGFPLFFLYELKNRHKKTKFTLYMSADRRSYGFSDEYLSLFDRVMTYSLNDANEFGLEYRPWFFSDVKEGEKDIDISFIGTIHPSRHMILSALKKFQKFELFYYILTPDRLNYLNNFWKWRNLNKYINFRGLPYHAYIDILSRSIATLDIPDSIQTNITTRPIEALATRTKIITTNSEIQRYDFYNKNNIYIINGTIEPEEIQNWLIIPYSEISPNIKNNYNIESWCYDIVQ